MKELKNYASLQDFLKELGIDEEAYKTIYVEKKPEPEPKPIVVEEPKSNERTYSSLLEFFQSQGLDEAEGVEI